MKLTDWFDADVKPRFVGWYEREWPSPSSRAAYDWWSGKKWYHGYGEGISRSLEPSSCALRWRGLAEDPNRSKP